MSYRSSKRTLSFLAVLLFACVLGAVPARATTSPAGPVVTAFAATSPSATLDIPITSFTAVNATSYLITISSTAPSAGDSGWLSTAPLTYTVSSAGSHTLYAWAKDAGGNVSASKSATVIVCSAAITVTSGADSGAGTLRQALVDICANGTITFADNYTIALSSTLNVGRNVTIDGANHAVVLDGGHSVQILFASASITLTNLTLQNGRSFGSGGGVFNAGGTMTITNSTFSGNSANGVVFNGGGGVCNDRGTVAITNSTFSGNSAPGAAVGGGVYNFGTMTITNSIFSENSSSHGGGVYNDGGTMTIANSTFSGNSAAVGGGVFHNGGTVAITNSTFSGNSADLYGGGVFNYDTMTITNSTFSENSAAHGGGVYNYASLGTLTLKNTIMANSTGGGVDCSGTLSDDSSNNLIKDGSCGTAGDPKLGLLADNGGPTQTMALLAGSPAIDAGDPATCAADPVSGKDQRGFPRPSTHCSIGAYEAQANMQIMDGLTEIFSGGSSVDFGTTTVGSPVTKTFAVNNTGLAELVLTPPISVPTGFMVPSSFGSTTVAAGGSTTFQVALAATAPGSPSGTLSLVSDLASQSPFTFTIEGVVNCQAQQYVDNSGACADCRTCGSEEYESTACSPATNRECSACTTCTAGSQYETTACQAGGQVAQNRVCADCTTAACASGTFQSATCSTTADRVCSSCSTTCPAATFQSATCSATADRVCSACSTTCPAGTYRSATCSATADRVCSACSTTCPSGTYRRAACSATADRVCSACSTGCPSGTYLAQACKPTSDRICVPFPIVADAGADGRADATVEGVDAEADGGVVALDADAVADTWTGSPIDSGASALDSLLFPEVQLVGLTDAGDSISPSSDARSAADAGWDAQQDGNRDGKLAGPDAAQVADTAWTGAGVDATADAMATIGRDAQADGSHLSDAGGGKRDNGCNCSLSLREPQSRGGLVALMLGLVLAACGRKVSRRRR